MSPWPCQGLDRCVAETAGMSHREMALDALCNEAKPVGRNGGEGETVWTAFVPRGCCTRPTTMDVAEGLMTVVTSLAWLRTNDQAKFPLNASKRTVCW